MVVARGLNLSANGNVAAQVKNAYSKIILPFEMYAEQHREAYLQHPLAAKAEESPRTDPVPLNGEDAHMTDATAPGTKQARPRKRMMGTWAETCTMNAWLTPHNQPAWRLHPTTRM